MLIGSIDYETVSSCFDFGLFKLEECKMYAWFGVVWHMLLSITFNIT